jgi:hypothetical protein
MSPQTLVGRAKKKRGRITAPSTLRIAQLPLTNPKTLFGTTGLMAPRNGSATAVTIGRVGSQFRCHGECPMPPFPLSKLILRRNKSRRKVRRP